MRSAEFYAIGVGSLLLVGLSAFGGGYVNGDIAVYLHQVSAGDFSQRTTHLGYLILVWAAQALSGGDGLGVMTWLNVAAGLFIAGVVAARLASGRFVAWSIIVAALLPVLSWAEVDLLWQALVIGAVYTPGSAASMVLLVAAVAVSPSALLAAPLACGLRPERWRLLVGASLLAVGVMTVVSGTDWWTGDRGVLALHGFAPVRTHGAWAQWCPWILLPFIGPWMANQRVGWLFLPVLFLLPPDVPGWILGAVLIAIAAARAWEADFHRRYLVAAVTLHLVIAAIGWSRERARVVDEAAVVSHVAASLEARDRVLAPWSLGVRVSLAATGDPYGLRWMAVPYAVRDQQERFCELPGGRTAVLPPGTRVSHGTQVVDSQGVYWNTDGCRPNVVLVIGCTVRRDFIGSYGAQVSATPWLDSLATRGALFGDLIAVAPWTKPSVAALVTGRHPTSLKLIEPGPGRNSRSLPPAIDTLAGTLREAGYRTIGVTANPNLSERFGFDAGFEHYESLSPAWEQGVVKVPGTAVVATVLEALETVPRADRPSYLQLVLADPHAPLDESDQPQEGAYRVALRRMDRALAELETELESRGWGAHNTLWVFVGDHGEGLDSPPEHGPGHGRYLYPTTVSVPWLMAGPGVKAGARVGGLASQVDVAPTILGLLRHDFPSSSGEDWSTLLREPRGYTDRISAFSATWFLNTARGAVYGTDMVCQQDFGSGEQPAGRPGFSPGCYRRAGMDFGEAVEAPGLMRRLERWWAHQPKPVAVEALELDAATERHLRALGYTGEGP